MHRVKKQIMLIIGWALTEKTYLKGLLTGKVQTRLFSYRGKLEF